jgi:hypothetical protein
LRGRDDGNNVNIYNLSLISIVTTNSPRYNEYIYILIKHLLTKRKEINVSIMINSFLGLNREEVFLVTSQK